MTEKEELIENKEDNKKEEEENENDDVEANNKRDTNRSEQSVELKQDLTKSAVEEITENKNNENKKTWFGRTFGKMEEGSIRGSIFALSSLALGTGAFSIPIRCTQIGCVWYMVCTIIGALATYWSLSGMIRAARTVKGEDYSITVKRIIGNIPGICIDCIIMLYLFGVFVQYQVIIYSLIGRTYYEFFIDKNQYTEFEEYEKDKWDRAYLKYPIMFITALIILPVCFLKNISKMRFASLFGICALLYSILVVIVESPFFWLDFLKNHKAKEANWFDITKAFGEELDFFTTMATIFFTFSCHCGAFPVYKTLKDSSEKRINKVFLRSIILDLFIYLPIALCGFITAPLNPKSLIIFRDNNGVMSNDIAMTIAKISLALDLFLCIPANYAAFRCSFFITFFKTDQIDNTKNIIVTIPVILLSTLVGALYKDILSYISFLGGFCSSIFCFLVPGWMIIKTSDKPISSFSNILNIIIIVILCSIGFTGGVITIINNIK